jgi:hypothetical protein
MEGLVSLDTLYLVVRYPKADVYQNWAKHAEGIEHRKLKAGIAVGDFVLRTGASCYKYSVWQHDARVFLTDQVDDKVGEGRGSGIWVQLGPKFLIEHSNRWESAVKTLLYEIGVEGEYPIRVSRLDIAMDLFGVSMRGQEIKPWQDGWVGRSKVSGVFYNSRTGDLETIYIGSRKSAVFLRIYDKLAQAIKEGDIEYWLDVWKGRQGAVTRVEWQVLPGEGNFQDDLRDLSQLNGFSIRELLNYLLNWGRLCIPDPNDSNNRRWKDAEFWQGVRDLAQAWSDGVDWPTSRLGKQFHPVSWAYVQFVSGTIAGAAARLSEKDVSIMGLFEGLKEYGEDTKKITKKAKEKAEVFSKL